MSAHPFSDSRFHCEHGEGDQRIFFFNLRSRDRSVRIATSWTVGVRFLAGVRNVSALHSVKNGSGPHPMGTGGYFPGITRPGCEADYAPLSRIVELYLRSPIRLHAMILV
jgi:hypothetical protein